MAFYFAEGSRFQFCPSTSFSAASTVSAATNANPSVLTTSAAHGLVDNDEFVFFSGWEDATDTVYRADQLTTTTLSPLGLDTTNTSFFGAGSGTGTLQKIPAWTDIPQVVGISSQGGDPRFTNVELLAKRNATAVPTGFNSTTITLELAHDPAQAGYVTMVGLSRALTKCAFRMVLSGGGYGYGYGYLAVSEVPRLNRNQVNTVSAALTLIGRYMSY